MGDQICSDGIEVNKGMLLVRTILLYFVLWQDSMNSRMRLAVKCECHVLSCLLFVICYIASARMFAEE